MNLISQLKSKEDRPFFIALGVTTIFYMVLIALFSPSGLVGDEERYLFYAKNLSNGFYVPPAFPDFTNGPAYPIILAPFVLMDAPIWMMRGLNAFFLAGAMYFFYRTARLYISPRWSLIFALAIALNPVQLRYIGHAKTEAVSVFFFCAFIWALANWMRCERWEWKWVIRAALLFFALTMTRVLFGYVATAALVAIPICCIVFGYRQQLLKAVAPFAAALVLCLPWLAFTHHHTGKHFCWSTNGGELLYWITSPYDGEWGTWFSLDDLADKPEAAVRHMRISAAVEAAPYHEHDALWKQHAMENIRKHPKAVIRNLAANFNRIFFAFPRSYRHEELKTILWILPNAVTLFLAALAVYPTIRAWRRIPLEIKLAGLIGLIFFGGSVLLPAEPRYLLPVAPAMLWWLSFAFGRIVQVSLAMAPEESPLPDRQALA